MWIRHAPYEKAEGKLRELYARVKGAGLPQRATSSDYPRSTRRAPTTGTTASNAAPLTDGFAQAPVSESEGSQVRAAAIAASIPVPSPPITSAPLLSSLTYHPSILSRTCP